MKKKIKTHTIMANHFDNDKMSEKEAPRARLHSFESSA